jgi:hypothetical protein
MTARPLTAYRAFYATHAPHGPLVFGADEPTATAHERADRQEAAHGRGWDLNVKTLMHHWDGQLIHLALRARGS